MSEPFPLDFAPGIVKVDAPHTLRGRYIDCDKVRFLKGKPQKWAGWKTFKGSLVGVPRAITVWDDNSNGRWIAVGTHTKLYQITQGAILTDITPIRTSGTLALNPFAMVNGMTTVTVTHAGHGEIGGSTVIFAGATAAGGIYVNGSYLVATVIDTNTYTIVHSVAATSTVSGGGAAVTYSYEINVGYQSVVQGRGYGTSTYGTSTYGTPRTTSGFTTYPRIWSLDTYGQNLLAMPSGDNLYQWDPTTPSTRAVKVANSPTGTFMFITNERYVVVLGANSDPLQLAWPDQNDITNWTPSATVTANIRKLQKGSRLVAGANLNGTANILWTDDSVYSMNYTGARNFVYNTLVAGERCGLIGPHAFAVAKGRAFWMSNYDFFMYGGSVQDIPNSMDIRDWLFARLDMLQNWKCAASFTAENNEIKWNYVLSGFSEPAFYVAVSLDDYTWTYGTENRTAWKQKGGINAKTYGTDENGTVFQHEYGLNADGAAMTWFLESAPMEIDGGKSLMDVQGYVPNFQRQVGDIQLTIKTYDLPQMTTPTETATATIFTTTGIVDLNLSGRQTAVRLDGFSVGGDFRLGIPDIEIKQAGSRRGGP